MYNKFDGIKIDKIYKISNVSFKKKYKNGI